MFGFFAFQTYFQDDEVDEALPFFAAGPAPSGIEGDETTEDVAEAMNEAMAADDMPMVEEVDEPMPEMDAAEASGRDEGGTQETQPVDEGAAGSVEEAPPADEPEPTEAQPEPAGTQPEPAEPQIIVEASGSFIDRSHPTEGSALVLGDGSG